MQPGPDPAAAAPAETEPSARRAGASHRWLTAPAAVVVFATMWMPTSSSCHEVSRPTDDPSAWWHYGFALVIAVVALTSTARPREWIAALATGLYGALVGVVMGAHVLLDKALLGGALAAAAAFALCTGAVLWAIEIGRPSTGPRIGGVCAALAIGWLFAYAAITVTVPFEPPPPAPRPPPPTDADTTSHEGDGGRGPSAEERIRAQQSAAHAG